MEETLDVGMERHESLPTSSSTMLTLTEILFVTVFCACVTMLIQNSWRKYKLERLCKNIDMVKCYPIIGCAHLFRGTNEDVLKALMNLIDNHLTPMKAWLGNDLFVVVYEPHHLERAFNSPNALEKHDLYKFMQPVVGNGLFNAPVTLWKKTRKLLSPTFNQKILNNFVATFYEESVTLSEMLEKHTKRTFCVKHLIGNFTLDTVVKTSMGVELHQQRRDTELGKVIDRLIGIAFFRMFKIWYHPDFIFYNAPIGREFSGLVKRFVAITDRIIAEQKVLYLKHKEWCNQHPEAETEELSATKLKTFLQLIFQLNEEDRLLTDEQVSSEVRTFLVAGSDTTAVVLSFCLIMLGMHPECQERIYEEVMDVVGPDRAIEHEDLPQLKYLDRFISETNRLFPVGPIVVRENVGDVDLGDCVLPRGSATLMAILYTHRSEKYWPNPLKFDPDRFLPEEVAKRHPYAYVPFTAGPRNCIGKRYGIMLLRVALAQISRRFKVTTPYRSVAEIGLKQDLLLQPVDGYKVQFESRD